MVGEMAKEYPALARRVYDAGHTIGTHSMSHPLRFRALSVERGNAQIDDGIAAIAAALGGAEKVAPFFRFPGFGRTDAAERTCRRARPDGLGRRLPADDWMTRSARGGPARRAPARRQGQGHPAAARHPPAYRRCAAEHSRRAEGPRLPHRPCGAGERRAPPDRHRGSGLAGGAPAAPSPRRLS